MISIVYPASGHQAFEDATFLVGTAEGAKAIRVERTVVKTTKSGCFCIKIALKPGKNTVLIEAMDGRGNLVSTETLNIERTPPFEVLPALPLRIQPETLLPSGDLTITPGESFIVAISASRDADVSLEVPGLLETPVPLHPVPVDEGVGEFVDTRTAIFAELHQTSRPIPKRGYYRGQVYVPATAKAADKQPMSLILRHGGQEQRCPMPGTISVWTTPRFARVVSDRAIVRTEPERGARLTPQRAGTVLSIDGQRANWLRVRLSTEQSFWIAENDVAWRLHDAPAEATIDLIRVTPVKGTPGEEIQIPLRGKLPLVIEAEPDRLVLSLHGAVSRCDFVHYEAGLSLVKQVTCRQPRESAVKIEITLNTPGLAGYDYTYTDDGLVLSLKRLPNTIPQTRVLIDAGHGGEETGAHGCSGLPEKALNLSLSALLATALQQAGFQVIQSRTQDVAVSLQERAALAASVNADIVLSLHHNALPDGRDPGAHRGASFYYYHAFAQDLAKSLQARLTTQALGGYTLSDYGILYDSLHMTRIHQATAVLVEIGFMTHPEEFEYLVSPAFQQAVAQSLTQALLSYCQTRTSQSG